MWRKGKRGKGGILGHQEGERGGANEPKTNIQKGRKWIQPPAEKEMCSSGLKNTDILLCEEQSSVRASLNYF